MTTEDERRCTVLLAVQQALLGEVTPNLRAIAVQYDEVSIWLEAFFDAQPSEQDEEAMSLVETELMAAFSSGHAIKVTVVTRPEPQQIPKDRAWAYFRKETLLD